jgi:hypothetical protein
MIQTAKFPAGKTGGDDGIWISNTESIDKWSFGVSMDGHSKPQFGHRQ